MSAPEPAHTANSGTTQGNPRDWRGIWRQLRSRRRTRWTLRILAVMCVVALFADVLAYDKPIICHRKGQSVEFPILTDYLIDLGFTRREGDMIFADWHALDYDWAVWPPVRYLPAGHDKANMKLLSPFADQKVEGFMSRHHLGTLRDGRDLASGLIHGMRISLTIGFVAVGISGIIGILLGGMAGYFGDNRLRLTTASILLGLLGLFLGYFYGFHVRHYVLRDALAQSPVAFLWQLLLSGLLVIATTVAMVQVGRLFARVPVLGTKRYVWLDIIFSRLVEIMRSIPLILLLISLAAVVTEKSIYFTMVVIGLMGWTSVAQFMRGEMLRTRQLPFVEAAEAMGMSPWRVLLRHAIPNSLTSVIVVLTFSVSGTIALEASLSFLGIGVPPETVTWGSLLNEGRQHLHAWWLILFPSLAVFITITTLNILGDALREAIDPHRRIV